MDPNIPLIIKIIAQQIENASHDHLNQNRLTQLQSNLNEFSL